MAEGTEIEVLGQQDMRPAQLVMIAVDGSPQAEKAFNCESPSNAVAKLVEENMFYTKVQHSL